MLMAIPSKKTAKIKRMILPTITVPKCHCAVEIYSTTVYSFTIWRMDLESYLDFETSCSVIAWLWACVWRKRHQFWSLYIVWPLSI